jgi:hypothetical protein
MDDERVPEAAVVGREMLLVDDAERRRVAPLDDDVDRARRPRLRRGRGR